MVTEERSTTEYGPNQQRTDVHVHLTADGDEFKAWLYEYTTRRALVFQQSDNWNTTKRLPDLDGELLLATDVKRHAHEAALIVRGMFAYVFIDPNDDECRVTVYAERYIPGDMQATIDQLRTWLEPKQDETEDHVPVDFRYSGNRGSYVRGIEAPAWQEIRPNYPASVAATLDRLFEHFEAGSGGRLILLHGQPGTGKTYVIRALARTWRSWCSAVYIADPEKFFGSAEYMIQTLLEGVSKERWRMLIVEDAGELLSQDAKKERGQGLSRLLNVAEGLIGQGLRVLVLISTNEKLQALNEAVSRPGRTAAEIEFTAFSADEANAWLSARGRQDLNVKSSATLAELYAMLSGARIATQPKREPLGFVRR
jgi:hypothetical protein